MAINPNFVFSDPALQAQVVNAAQVRAAADAARAQQFAQTLAAMRQERQQAADLAERRAIREGDIRRLDANEAERRRQFDANQALQREAIASSEKIASGRQGRATEDERYNNVLSTLAAAERGTADLPTERELEPLLVDFTPERQRALRGERSRIFAVLSRNADLIDEEVAGLNQLLQQGAKDKDGNPYTVDSVLGLSQFKNNIRKNRATGRLESLARRPRRDALGNASEGVFPQPSLGFVPRDTDFRVPVAPTAPTAPAAVGVEPVADVLGRTRGMPSSFRRGTEEAGDLLLGDALRRTGAGAANVLGREVSGITGALTPFRVPSPPSLGVLAPTQLPFEGSAFRVPPPVAARTPTQPVPVPDLIPAEAFDVSPGGFTGGEKMIQRGLRLTETRRDAALRRLAEARKTYPDAELVERPDGIFISPTRRTFFVPEAPARLAPTLFPSEGSAFRRQVLSPLDYTGPEYDYSGATQRLPIDDLAPPVFAPGY